MRWLPRCAAVAPKFHAPCLRSRNSFARWSLALQLCGEAHPLRLPVLLGHGRLLNAIGQTEAGIVKAKEVSEVPVRHAERPHATA